MENTLFIICALVILVIGGVLFFNRKKSNNNVNIDYSDNKEIINGDVISKDIIKVETISAEELPDDIEFNEIKDSNVIARITSLIPGLINTTKDVFYASKGVLYKAIIPPGTSLSEATNMPSTVRGIYHGANGIKGHANFKSVDGRILNSTAAVMNVASMIVGQYYIAQIDKELSNISNTLSKISNFQNNEYKSKIESLIKLVKKMAKFQTNTLENDDIRKGEINKLSIYEKECVQLIEQANLTIKDFAKKEDLDYEEYQKEVSEVQNWCLYQRTLFNILYKISELEYTLNLGKIPKEKSCTILFDVKQEIEKVREDLEIWHKNITKNLKIEIDNARRKRDGLDGIIHRIPGLIDEEYNYCAIDDNMVKMIKGQMLSYPIKSKITYESLFEKEVRLIAKENKLYYITNKH